MVFVGSAQPVRLDRPEMWWAFVHGADWRHPTGPDSSLEGLEDHPVVHVALVDIEAYCAWAGTALPTEQEWEFAARAGLADAEFAWGDAFEPEGVPQANTWQGTFPVPQQPQGRLAAHLAGARVRQEAATASTT
jgi:formylglycine-generating enzyme required for sulfatase activity